MGKRSDSHDVLMDHFDACCCETDCGWYGWQDDIISYAHGADEDADLFCPWCEADNIKVYEAKLVTLDTVKYVAEDLASLVLEADSKPEYFASFGAGICEMRVKVMSNEVWEKDHDAAFEPENMVVKGVIPLNMKFSWFDARESAEAATAMRNALWHLEAVT